MASERHFIDITLLMRMLETVPATYAVNEGGRVKYSFASLVPLEYKLRIECIIAKPDGSEVKHENEIDLLTLFEIPRP